MDTNEIMVNEEVMEAAEEIVTIDSGKSIKMAAGIGLAVLTGVIVYRYIAKPVMAKIKAKKNQQAVEAETDKPEDSEIVDEIDETNE